MKGPNGVTIDLEADKDTRHSDRNNAEKKNVRDQISSYGIMMRAMRSMVCGSWPHAITKRRDTAAPRRIIQSSSLVTRLSRPSSLRLHSFSTYSNWLLGIALDLCRKFVHELSKSGLIH